MISARVEINQITVGGQDGKNSHMFSCVIITVESVNSTFITHDETVTATPS